jgi:hypothetical protein
VVIRGDRRGKAATDPRAVRVVERNELVGDDARRLVNLLGRRRGVLVHQQAAQLAEPLQPPRALCADHTDSLQSSEVAPRVELVAAAPHLGELEPERCKLCDVVVELVDASLD